MQEGKEQAWSQQTDETRLVFWRQLAAAKPLSLALLPALNHPKREAKIKIEEKVPVSAVPIQKIQLHSNAQSRATQTKRRKTYANPSD